MKRNATEEFAAHIEAARIELAHIKQALEDHLEVDPDKVHWANVGDAQLVRAERTQIADRLLKRGEFAV